MNYWNDNESLVKSLSRCKNHKQPQQGNPWLEICHNKGF